MKLEQQFGENDVDYGVEKRSLGAIRLRPWQMALFALLAIIILASFIIITSQAIEIREQAETIQELCSHLQKTVDPLPTPCLNP